jgi:hypothetical protein
VVIEKRRKEKKKRKVGVLMRKVLVSLLVLALCAPAMAVTVDVATDGTITLDSTEDGKPMVGVSLDITYTGALTGKVTAVTVDTANFNIYVDAAYSQELGGDYVYGTGEPVCDIVDPGQTALPATQLPFAVCFANLNGETTAGADGATVVQLTLTVDADCEVAISENAARSGIVATDGTGLDISGQTGALITGGPGECVSSSAAFYGDWVTWGSPDCWCYAKNCLGDFDGLAQGNSFTGFTHVFTNDLNAFLPAYNIKEPPKGVGIAAGEICADFARDAQGNSFTGFVRVFTNDLNILLASYNIKEPPKGVGIGDCTGPDYNFFIDP